MGLGASFLKRLKRPCSSRFALEGSQGPPKILQNLPNERIRSKLHAHFGVVQSGFGVGSGKAPGPLGETEVQ